MERLEEIRQRTEAGGPIRRIDMKYLLSEVDRMNKVLPGYAESARKENEELKNILRFNMVQIHGERMTVLDALSSLTARAEKAEAEIKSIHEALCFADKCRSTCTNYTELAVSNGLALGRIAVAIQHDYDAEPPKGE